MSFKSSILFLCLRILCLKKLPLKLKFARLTYLFVVSCLSAFKYCVCILGRGGIKTASWGEYIAWTAFRLARKLGLTRIMRFATSTQMFMAYFKGFEQSQAVRGIFGDKTEEVLRNLKVDFTWFGYMGVNDANGHMMVNRNYLNNGDKTDIYLDVVHELCHVKQHLEGKELFDPRYDYVDRPTEVAAYRYAVKEAQRLGLGDQRILAYLKTEWMSNADLKRLVKNIGADLHVDED